MGSESAQGRADQMARSIEVFGRILDPRRAARPSFARSMPRRRARPARRCSTAAPPSPRSARSSRWRRERPHDDHRRALGRLGPDRLRQRPEARTLWRHHASSAPSRRRCGRRRATTGIPMRPSFPARTRKAAAAGCSTGRCRGNGSWRAAMCGSHASLTPFRHLGFFPDMAPQWDWMRAAVPADADVLNLFGYTGVGTLAAERCRRAAGPCRCIEEIGRAGQGQCAPLRHGRTGRSAGSSTMPANSPRARCGAGGATTASCSTRPSSGAGPTGEVWRLEENLAPLLADCRRLARREQPLPGAHRLCGAHVGARDRRAGEADARRSRRHGRDGRNGGARRGEGAAASDGDLRALV